MSSERLRRPQPEAIHLEPARTAVAVLDLSVRCDDENDVCSELMHGLRTFLDRARAAGVPIVFTSGLRLKGTPEAEVASALNRRPSEPLVHPDGFDKFVGGELHQLLSSRNIKNLVIVGSSTHVCVLYTAATAVRVYQYDVIIPLDGVNTRDAVNHDAALHLLQTINGVLPHSSRIAFSTEDMISFG